MTVSLQEVFESKLLSHYYNLKTQGKVTMLFFIILQIYALLQLFLLEFRLLNLQVADVLNQMDQDWGSLACPSTDSQNFWNHEWTKHGTCSGLTQHQYFQSAVDLYNQYDITAALAAAGTKFFVQPSGMTRI